MELKDQQLEKSTDHHPSEALVIKKIITHLQWRLLHNRYWDDLWELRDCSRLNCKGIISSTGRRKTSERVEVVNENNATRKGTYSSDCFWSPPMARWLDVLFFLWGGDAALSLGDFSPPEPTSSLVHLSRQHQHQSYIWLKERLSTQTVRTSGLGTRRVTQI